MVSARLNNVKAYKQVLTIKRLIITSHLIIQALTIFENLYGSIPSNNGATLNKGSNALGKNFLANKKHVDVVFPL